MKTFLIQTIDSKVRHDFAFHLIEALAYHEWYAGSKQYEIVLSNDALDIDATPIGSLEFVFSFLLKRFGIMKETIRPLNVPRALRLGKFLRREYKEMEKEEIGIISPHFIKSAARYKEVTTITDSVSDFPDGPYIVSEVVDIESEWRAFVFNGKLVGLTNYAGDFTRFPNIESIHEMIQAYQYAPVSYTLDVGINDRGTFVIEAHPFVSCGLYGFQDFKLLPAMFISGFRSFYQTK